MFSIYSGLFHLNTSVLPRNTIGGEKKFKNDLNSNRLNVSYIYILYCFAVLQIDGTN